ncbi:MULTISPECIES: CRISPR-associated helicase Cas3' [unclassified Methanoculleus]|jgi:CRISPR-associated endonuclease/helicase Cas3|uniref:CRISPR-associated helicase Cas3 n=2 Tax=Methanoculleus TaxID=45989 RepID=A0ABD8A895_9EURY|nr:CRISPR-associated helicase Cas3' [Methanoculleus palmolei]
MNQTMWAKRDQTYAEHVLAAYAAWQATVKAKRPLIQRLGKRWGFEEERFLQRSLFTVILHDIGKNILPFQRMMQMLRAGRRPTWSENYRHELVSYSVMLRGSVALDRQEGPLLDVAMPLDALAVLGHHKRLNPDLQSFERELTLPPPQLCEQGMQDALDLAATLFEQEGYRFPSLTLKNLNPANEVRELIGPEGVFFKFYEQFADPAALRETYAVLKAILHYADWYGSAGKPVKYTLPTGSTELRYRIADRCRKRNISFAGLLPFQETCASTSGHCIAIAPTGSGKTEGALLWALHNIAEMRNGKLLYLLPTMVTANSIYRRLEEYFGKGNVGVSHSTASLLFLDEEDLRTARDALFDRSFILPATVATVDQLLTAGFNTGRWTLIEANAANSVIIIDEIHAYDPWTLALILRSVEHFACLGARFMLMSATMPRNLLNLLQTALPGATVVRDTSLLDSARNTFGVVDAEIEEMTDQIREAVCDGRKTLVSVNSVGKCQDLTRTFADLNPICYHSKFTLQDRTEKEKAIDEKEKATDSGSFLIATQVVEVSLDINFDLMFTECAPPDALVQRAGRINRRRTKEDTTVTICRPSEISRKIYESNSTDLLARSYAAFQAGPARPTEADLTAIVEQVYTGTEIVEDPRFLEASKAYAQSQRRLLGVYDNPILDTNYEVTRKVDYPQIPVIPLQFQETVRDLPPIRRQYYEVKMPLWYVKKHREVRGDVVFCDMEYDPELGARFTERPEEAYRII